MDILLAVVWLGGLWLGLWTGWAGVRGIQIRRSFHGTAWYQGRGSMFHQKDPYSKVRTKWPLNPHILLSNNTGFRQICDPDKTQCKRLFYSWKIATNKKWEQKKQLLLLGKFFVWNSVMVSSFLSIHFWLTTMVFTGGYFSSINIRFYLFTLPLSYSVTHKFIMWYIEHAKKIVISVGYYDKLYLHMIYSMTFLCLFSYFVRLTLLVCEKLRENKDPTCMCYFTIHKSSKTYIYTETIVQM